MFGLKNYLIMVCFPTQPRSDVFCFLHSEGRYAYLEAKISIPTSQQTIILFYLYQILLCPDCRTYGMIYILRNELIPIQLAGGKTFSSRCNFLPF